MILKNNLINTELIFEKSGIGHGSKVADFGCGRHGYFVFATANKVGSSGIVYGVDVVRDIVQEIEKRAKRENLKQVKAIWNDIEVPNSSLLPSAFFDVTLIINTMYQLKSHVSVIREANRILKQKGLLLVIDWKNHDLGFGPVIDKRLLEGDIIEMANRCGMDFESSFPVGDFHYGLIFSKV